MTSVYILAVIKETLQIVARLKAIKRKLAIGKHRMYALGDGHGNLTLNVDAITEVAKRCYTRLYASDVTTGETIESTS